MTHVTFRTAFHNAHVELEPGETVLAALERAEIPVPFSCRSGNCHTCLVRARHGTPPPEGQQDLPPTWRRLGYFLACVSEPETPLEVTFVDSAERWSLEVHSVRSFADGSIVRLSRPTGFDAIAARTCRCLDSSGRGTILQSDDTSLDVYFARHARPAPSVSETLSIEGPSGDAFWVPEFVDRSVAVACDGLGWPAALGFVHDALTTTPRVPPGPHVRPSHRSHLTVWLPPEVEPYWRRWFSDDPRASVVAVRIHNAPLSEVAILDVVPDLTGWTVFLAGDATTLRKLRRPLFLAGAAPSSLLLARTEESAP